ncbi:flagellar basal body M-ring protein FliF [Aliidiomarina shirensis]|uniref:Flagellar M-ring protein n=1 Tax=Aliidiomarina shirensis TaxID=1048642 RepID=A0A432WPD6_9GAMM|nr:flagellar basal-body MS-ring/collar protein FliF [Aliidiomarina shirensis]RUO35598.1 flagellar basal body M-ring protein FliF [Aliidiomarina shirensis]
MESTINQQTSAASAATTNPSTSTQLDKVLGLLRGNSILPILIGGAAFIAVVVALIMWATTPEYRVLYSNLSESDGGQIVTELEAQRIPYQLSAGGTSILVPGDQVHRVRLGMAEQGLPQGGNTGFSLMDNQSFGISQFAEQVNFQRALEGELASSMESLGPVNRARVHLAMAKPSVFVRDREPAKASVILNLHAGRTLGEGQVNAIVHMVSSSVPELTAENVTVVDQQGTLLSANGQSNDLSGTELSYTEEVERTYQRRIEELLAPILGRDNLNARVTAQIDFSRIEETSETYSPNQTPETAAVRSIQSNLSLQGEGDFVGGVPGALSNTPPGVVTAPIEAPEEGEETTGNQPSQNNRNVRQDNIVNYEVDRNIAHIQHQRGRLERLSVAVVVNHRSAVDEEGNPTAVPLTENELAQVERLVQQAMGFNAARGDQLEIVNSRFVSSADPLAIEPREWWQEPDTQQLIIQVGRYVLAGLGILLFYLLILRPMINRRFVKSKASDVVDSAEESEAPSAKPSSRIRAVVGDDEEDDALPTSGEDADAMTFNWPKKKNMTAYDDAVRKTQEIARQKPRQVARIVQNWLTEDEHVRD